MSGGDNFGIYRGGLKNTDDRTQGQVLSDFMVQMEDYTPTVSTTIL
jgi:transcription initiation factor TFIID subunit 10